MIVIKLIDIAVAKAALGVVSLLLHVQRWVRRAPIMSAAVFLVVGYLWRGL